MTECDPGAINSHSLTASPWQMRTVRVCGHGPGIHHPGQPAPLLIYTSAWDGAVRQRPVSAAPSLPPPSATAQSAYFLLRLPCERHPSISTERGFCSKQLMNHSCFEVLWSLTLALNNLSYEPTEHQEYVNF